MTRREVLELFISYSFNFLIFFLFIFLYLIYPKRIDKKSLQYIYLIDEDDLPKKEVKKVEYRSEQRGKVSYNRLYIVFFESTYFALSPICTHLGCHVNWDGISKEFICPCHSGRFDMTGKVISGPPIEPLRRMPLKIEDNKVYVGVYL